MEIRNEEHAREMIKQWQNLPVPARKKEISLAMEQLELSTMYYEQKGNENGAERSARCHSLLREHLSSLEE